MPYCRDVLIPREAAEEIVPTKVYANRSHYDPKNRRDLNMIIKALWNDKSPERRRLDHGQLPELFVSVDRPEDAELCLLTNTWNHYVDQGSVRLAEQAVEEARRTGKPMVVFSAGDLTANVPWPDVYVFECSSYRSRANGRTHAMPPFFEDTAAAHFGGEPPLRLKEPRPVVGFCGQAGGSSLQILGRRIRGVLHRMIYRTGFARWEPPPFEHTRLRKRVLDAFAKSQLVEACFTLRDKYRAGLSAADDGENSRAQSKRDFLENMINTDYTVCVRGGGNFSKRFYEALCMGRVPILIDTDCALPFHDLIDWRKYCVWVDVSEFAIAPQRVAEFHARYDAESWAELSRACRRLWLERLTSDGFYSHFLEHFAWSH